MDDGLLNKANDDVRVDETQDKIDEALDKLPGDLEKPIETSSTTPSAPPSNQPADEPVAAVDEKSPDLPPLPVAPEIKKELGVEKKVEEVEKEVKPEKPETIKRPKKKKGKFVKAVGGVVMVGLLVAGGLVGSQEVKKKQMISKYARECNTVCYPNEVLPGAPDYCVVQCSEDGGDLPTITTGDEGEEIEPSVVADFDPNDYKDSSGEWVEKDKTKNDVYSNIAPVLEFTGNGKVGKFIEKKAQDYKDMNSGGSSGGTSGGGGNCVVTYCPQGDTAGSGNNCISGEDAGAYEVRGKCSELTLKSGECGQIDTVDSNYRYTGLLLKSMTGSCGGTPDKGNDEGDGGDGGDGGVTKQCSETCVDTTECASGLECSDEGSGKMCLNPSCTTEADCTCPEVSYSCASLAGDSDFEYGSTETFTCTGANFSAVNPVAYFRYKVDSGGYTTSSAVAFSGTTASYDLQVKEYGDWVVQCRVCANSTTTTNCTSWGNAE